MTDSERGENTQPVASEGGTIPALTDAAAANDASPLGQTETPHPGQQVNGGEQVPSVTDTSQLLPTDRRATRYKIETFEDKPKPYVGFFELRLVDSTYTPTLVESRFLRLLNGTLGGVGNHVPREDSRFAQDIKDARNRLVKNLTEQTNNFLRDGVELSCLENIVSQIAGYNQTI